MMTAPECGGWRSGVASVLLGAALFLPVPFALVLFTALAPAMAQDAAIGASPSAGSMGFPDGRAYEQVSPIEKNGNEAGAWKVSIPFNPINEGYSIAAGDGEALLYRTDGPVGSVMSGAERLAVSRRTPSGWTTSGAIPAPAPAERDEPLAQGAGQLDPGADLSRLVFEAAGSYAAADPANSALSAGAFLTGEDISVEAEWLSAPGEPFSEAMPEPGHLEGARPLILAGGSPNLEVVYFSYFGTLLPADAARKSYVEEFGEEAPWGFYEFREGALKAVGILPEGSPFYPGQLDPHGAVPAGAFDHGNSDPAAFDNTVSEDGQRAFFVSPDPNAAASPPEGDPAELYVRERGERTLLISRDELNGGAPAPEYSSSNHMGITAVGTPLLPSINKNYNNGTFAYAAPDGSRVFFESQDRLTADAPEGSAPKTYEFNLEAAGGNGSLTYVPEVVGPAFAASRDGGRVLFENTSVSPARLELWEETSSGGQQLTDVAELNGRGGIEPAGATADGSVFVFEAEAELDPGKFKNSGGYTQVYRYTVGTEGHPEGQLTCMSCVPGTVAPSGDARLSNATSNQPGSPKVEGLLHGAPVGARFMSANGNRVFFDTPEALVPQDVNGQRDVYEWEAAGEGTCSASAAGGCIYLISAGTSAQPSVFLGTSESGNDVFFATAEGLVAGDSDAGYDVYDARQPHVPGEPVGFPAPASPASCAGGDCQSGGTSALSPAGASLLSATANPSGNLIPLTTSPQPKQARAQRLAAALKRCAKRHRRRSARKRCERQAKRRYRVKSAKQARVKGASK